MNFLDVTIGHDPIDWDKTIGNNDIAGTGSGASLNGKVFLSNSAWARAGLFGGGFGIDLANEMEAGGKLLSKNFELFSIGLHFKFDAAIRNKFAEDLGNMLADVLASLDVRELVNGLAPLSVSKGSAQKTSALSASSCELEQELISATSALNSALPSLGQTRSNGFGEMHVPRRTDP